MPVESPPSPDGRVRKRAAFLKTLTFGAATLVAVLSLAMVSGDLPLLSAMSSLPASPTAVRLANFGDASPSPEARHVADWVADSRDNAHAEFIIVDKRDARVYVFDADARLRGSSPVLLGAALGDESVPGIGTRPIADVRPEERTTPAGRFVAERGRNLNGEDVVWVDYDAAVSMHRVRANKPVEQRLERLATPTVDDNRISYGCINVPVAFYETYVSPTVAAQRAIVYVLPEVKPVQQVFNSYDVVAPRRLASLKLK